MNYLKPVSIGLICNAFRKCLMLVDNFISESDFTYGFRC